MDFDTEAADDFSRAVKSWEDDLPCYLNRAGTDSDDWESDSGLLTPPPDFADDLERSWIEPPLRPTYAESWMRIMKRRVEDGCPRSIDQQSDTSSLSSYSELDARQDPLYDHPIDAQGYHCPASDDSAALAFSSDSINDDYKEGSTATAADAEDLFSEMLSAYTVPKELKTAIVRASSPRRKRSTSSFSKDKPNGISKRSSWSSSRSNTRNRMLKR